MLRSDGVRVLESAELAERCGTFDVVTAIEVVEPAIDPLDIFRRMAALLAPGGQLFLTTGNARPYRDRLVSWQYVVPEVHVSFYEPATLVRCMTEVGLRPDTVGVPGRVHRDHSQQGVANARSPSAKRRRALRTVVDRRPCRRPEVRRHSAAGRLATSQHAIGENMDTVSNPLAGTGGSSVEWAGHCTVCRSDTTMVLYGNWPRDHLLCRRSNPRFRALMYVLALVRPAWHLQRLWELAPIGPASDRLRADCPAYVGTHYWPDVAPGQLREGVRCEDVAAPTFDDDQFDIVVASDVFEHVMDVERALGSVARVLTPDGAFVWTVPQDPHLTSSRPRVRRLDDLTVEHVLPPEFHGDPVSEDGVLVTYDWGQDLADVVQAASGMTTTTFRIQSKSLGLLGEYVEVFVSSPSDSGAVAAVPTGSHGSMDRNVGQRVETLEHDLLSEQRGAELLAANLAVATQQIDSLSRDVAALRQAADAHRRDAEAVRGSTSWRVTRPLRWLSGVATRTRNRPPPS